MSTAGCIFTGTMNDRADRIFYVATRIVVAQVTPDKTHASPVLVKQAVDLAELLIAELDAREKPADAPPAGDPASTPPAP